MTPEIIIPDLVTIAKAYRVTHPDSAPIPGIALFDTKEGVRFLRGEKHSHFSRDYREFIDYNVLEKGFAIMLYEGKPQQVQVAHRFSDSIPASYTLLYGPFSLNEKKNIFLKDLKLDWSENSYNLFLKRNLFPK